MATNLQEELSKTSATSAEAQDSVGTETQETESASKPESAQQDPLKTELERVQKRESRSELEKAGFSLKKNAERFKELGGDPQSILGTNEVLEDDDKPLTVGAFKQMQKEHAVKIGRAHV